MKCLFVFNNAPLTENYHGAAARYTQAYKALVHMGIEVHVLRFLESKRCPPIVEFEKSQPRDVLAHYDQSASWQDVVYSSPAKKARSRLGAIAKGLSRPLEFAFPEIAALREPLLKSLDSAKPDFVLAEMYPAAAIIAQVRPELPWVFGHHDWLYRYRQPNRAFGRVDYWIRGRFISLVLHRAEVIVAQRSSAVISASITEATELRKLGARNVYAIPSTYDSAPAPHSASMPQRPMRIVHLGQLVTVSNALGLRDFLREVSPALPPEWELYIIGSTRNADSELLGELQAAGARILGRVNDLSTVMRPFDVSVIPSQHNLGERTKVPLLFNYAQVVVAHEASVAGSANLSSGDNCFLLPNLREFPGLLRRLANDDMTRKRIGLAAKATFERYYTLQAQIPTFKRVLAEMKA